MDEVLRRVLDQNEVLKERVLAAALAVGGADYLLSTDCTGDDQYRLMRLGLVITELRAALGISSPDDLPRAYPLPANDHTENRTDDRTHGRDEG